MLVKDKKLRINKNAYLVTFLVLGIAIKICFSLLFPEKYFYDGQSIINSIESGLYIEDKSYRLCVTLYAPLYHIFKISDARMASIALGVVCNILYCLVFLRKMDFSKNPFFTFLNICIICLLNIYVFTISKDLINFLFFCLVSFFLLLKKKAGVILAIVTIFLEGIFFRSYYLLILGFALAFIFTYKISFRLKRKKPIFLIVNCLLFIIIFHLLTSRFFSGEYNTIINIRDSINSSRGSSTDAVTMIKNVFQNKQNVLFNIANTIINMLRLVFPVEILSLNSAKYFLFFIFQISILLFLKHFINRRSSSTSIIAFFILISFLIVSSFFEPDFGSFVRHEISIIPQMFFVLEKTSYLKREKKKKIMMCLSASQLVNSAEHTSN